MNPLTSGGSRLNLLPMNTISREMNRWIDELTNDSSCVGNVPVSIWEDETHYQLEFDLPGVVVDDVDIWIDDNVLHVTANRPVNEDIKFLRQERKFGSVARKFSMPTRVDGNNIEAVCHEAF